MPEFTDFLENKLIDHAFRNVVYTPPVQVFLALHLTVNSDNTPGTEVSGAGYARKPVSFSAAVNGEAPNSGSVSFTPVGGNYGMVVSTALWDALSGGNQLCFDNDFVDIEVNDGEELKFNVNDILVSLS